MLASASCTGIFQDARPAVSAHFHRLGFGEQLLVGAAAADITPAGSVYLAGFGAGKVSTGVHHRLEARAMVFALGEMKVAVVGIDNLGLQRDDVEWIKSGITGFTNGCVFLASSHTHAGPDLVGLWGSWLFVSGRDPGYVAQVRDGVVRAIVAAESAARPARLLRGEARIPPSGLVRNSNRSGLFDPRLTLVQARALDDDRAIGTLVNMGCHPEVLRRANTLLSSDFVGPLCDRLGEQGFGQCVFVNGALGAMVTPQPANEDGITTMVDGLALVAQHAAAAATEVEVDRIEVDRRDLYMRMTSPGLLLGRLTMVIPRRAYSGQVRSTVGNLRIGPIEALCVPGEMEPTLAARIRQHARRPNLLLFGLVDDELGYLMREVDARDPEFEYERTMSPVVETGERISDAVLLPQSSR